MPVRATEEAAGNRVDWNKGINGGPSTITITRSGGSKTLVEGKDYTISNGTAYYISSGSSSGSSSSSKGSSGGSTGGSSSSGGSSGTRTYTMNANGSITKYVNGTPYVVGTNDSRYERVLNELLSTYSFVFPRQVKNSNDVSGNSRYASLDFAPVSPGSSLDTSMMLASASIQLPSYDNYIVEKLKEEGQELKNTGLKIKEKIYAFGEQIVIFVTPDPNSNWDMTMLQLEVSGVTAPIGMVGIAGRKVAVKVADYADDAAKSLGKSPVADFIGGLVKEVTKTEKHHIITDKSKIFDFKNHPVFKETGINVSKDIDNLVELANHRGRHTDAYHREVQRRLDAVYDRFGGTDKLESAVRKELQTMKQELLDGTLNPYGK